MDFVLWTGVEVTVRTDGFRWVDGWKMRTYTTYAPK